ncbi:UDP-glycosyltransferase 92A1-like [Populus alba x Populus x berolinensis]|nr:UDP-glycosyltransferase 92A1-like [Populus alba x Populus x berolinensis]
MASKSIEQIVMLPFMAHGHLIPFLALARQIHQATGFKISIASTPLNIQYLSSTFNSSSDEPENDHIHLLELPFCNTDNGLPENSENLSLDSIGKLFSASLSLRKPFHSLVSDIAAKQGHPPLCIISDVFLGWATEVASSLGTVNVTFSTGGAYGTLAYSSLWLNLPHRGRSDSDEFHLPGFPDSCRFHVNQLHHFLRNADGTDSWSKFFQSQISLSMQSFGWLCNTAEEFEPAGLEWLRNFLKLPVWAIGPLLPPMVLNNDHSSLSKCIEWLESHSPASVLYISFGSQNTISPSQMMELAIGLEESAKPFVWGGDMRSKAMVIKEQLRASVRDEGEDKGSSVKALDDLVKTLQSKWQMINSINNICHPGMVNEKATAPATATAGRDAFFHRQLDSASSADTAPKFFRFSIFTTRHAKTYLVNT